MAMIQITPDMLRGKATELRGLKQQHDDNINKIKNLVNGLTDQWKGDAQTAFLEKFNSMQPTMQQFTEMLESFARKMDESANILQEADANAARVNQG